VGEAITQLPADFTPHRQIKKIYEARREMVETGGGYLCSFPGILLCVTTES
jgi:2-oxoglutarate dehydrogenase complex dehydrogenase (E1) component-like enzyme